MGNKVPENAILLSMEVTSLYTNIPQEREYIQYARLTTLSIKTHLLSVHVYLTNALANITGAHVLVPVVWPKIIYKHTELPWAFKNAGRIC